MQPAIASATFTGTLVPTKKRQQNEMLSSYNGGIVLDDTKDVEVTINRRQKANCERKQHQRNNKKPPTKDCRKGNHGSS